MFNCAYFFVNFPFKGSIQALVLLVLVCFATSVVADYDDLFGDSSEEVNVYNYVPRRYVYGYRTPVRTRVQSPIGNYFLRPYFVNNHEFRDFTSRNEPSAFIDFTRNNQQPYISVGEPVNQIPSENDRRIEESIPDEKPIILQENLGDLGTGEDKRNLVLAIERMLQQILRRKRDRLTRLRIKSPGSDRLQVLEKEIIDIKKRIDIVMEHLVEPLKENPIPPMESAAGTLQESDKRPETEFIIGEELTNIRETPVGSKSSEVKRNMAIMLEKMLQQIVDKKTAEIERLQEENPTSERLVVLEKEMVILNKRIDLIVKHIIEPLKERPSVTRLNSGTSAQVSEADVAAIGDETYDESTFIRILSQWQRQVGESNAIQNILDLLKQIQESIIQNPTVQDNAAESVGIQESSSIIDGILEQLQQQLSDSQKAITTTINNAISQISTILDPSDNTNLSVPYFDE